MAGSYEHCRARGGKFQFDLIENMGDAHEACEMMFEMISILADGDRKKIKAAEATYYRRVRAAVGKSEGQK